MYISRKTLQNKTKKGTVMILKRLIAILMCLMMVLGLASCSRSGGKGEVYYLNFKPEQDAAWQKLAKAYTEETGVKVTLVTAAAGTYEDTLSAEIVKRNPPTLFQVNGPVGLAGWQDYCYDLSDTALYEQLTDDDYALGVDDKVYGIAYALETYGLIYNKTLLDRYFSLQDAKIKSMDEVNGFEALKTLAEDLQAHKNDLAIKGAFASAGMDASSDWRFKTHLANLPIYYEYEDRRIDSTAEIQGTFLNEYRRIWDLYLNNSTVEPTAIGAKTGDEALNEFLNGEAVFYQNGTWAWNEDMEQNIGAENVGMLPIYIGAPAEGSQGLCTGSENYWCVNKNADEQDIQATLDFLEWLVTSETGTTAMAEDMGFLSPFRQSKTTDNPLVKAADADLAAGHTPVSWNFSTIPSDNWKNGVGAALLAYAQGGQTDALWDKVKEAFVDGWRKEYKAAH